MSHPPPYPPSPAELGGTAPRPAPELEPGDPWLWDAAAVWALLLTLAAIIWGLGVLLR